MLAEAPQYFVLVIDGKPLANRYAPETPMVFQDEQTALAAVDRLETSAWPKQVVLERYSDNFDFLGRQVIQRPLLCSNRD